MRWTLVKFTLVKHYSFTDRCWLTDADMVRRQKLLFVYECWHCNEKHTWGRGGAWAVDVSKGIITNSRENTSKSWQTLTNSVQISQKKKEGQHDLETGRTVTNKFRDQSWERVEECCLRWFQLCFGGCGSAVVVSPVLWIHTWPKLCSWCLTPPSLMGKWKHRLYEEKCALHGFNFAIYCVPCVQQQQWTFYCCSLS